MEWQDKREVKKGNIGEEITKIWLKETGYIFYEAKVEGSHKVDIFCHEKTNKKIQCVESKAKKRMWKRPMSGCNLNSYEEYKDLYMNNYIDTFLIFTDDFEEWIYGQFLSQLSDGQIINGKSGKVIVWPLSQMIKIKKLTSEQLIELRKFSKPDSNYDNVKKFFIILLAVLFRIFLNFK